MYVCVYVIFYTNKNLPTIIDDECLCGHKGMQSLLKEECKLEHHTELCQSHDTGHLNERNAREKR